MDSNPPSAFLSNELENVLTEQAFGITSFVVDPSSAGLQASASVVLLEGNSVTIHLSSRGYSLDWNRSNLPSRRSNNRDSPTFETIEILLQSVSAMYERRRQQILVARLERLRRT